MDVLLESPTHGLPSAFSLKLPQIPWPGHGLYLLLYNAGLSISLFAYITFYPFLFIRAACLSYQIINSLRQGLCILYIHRNP